MIEMPAHHLVFVRPGLLLDGGVENQHAVFALFGKPSISLGAINLATCSRALTKNVSLGYGLHHHPSSMDNPVAVAAPNVLIK